MSNASVFDDLRTAIATSEIGPGEPLIESDVMERFDAGRPAVRVAIARLEQEGLVEQKPNRSARVRVIAAAEALEIAELRTLLERRAAAKAAGRATQADGEELWGILAEARHRRERDDPGAADLDRDLHAAILRIAGDGTLARMHGMLHGHLVRFHVRTRVEQAHSVLSTEEHEAIVDAITAGDADRADEAMAKHLGHLTSVLADALE